MVQTTYYVILPDDQEFRAATDHSIGNYCTKMNRTVPDLHKFEFASLDKTNDVVNNNTDKYEDMVHRSGMAH